MIKILEILGPQKEEKLEFIQDDNTLKYIQSLQHVKKHQPICKKFKKSDPKIQTLISSMLEFNPDHRMTAAECLKSSVFDGIRNKVLEEPAQGTV